MTNPFVFRPSAVVFLAVLAVSAVGCTGSPDSSVQRNGAAADAPLHEEVPPVNTTPDGGDAGAIDLTSTVALRGCSGGLVRFRTSKPEDQALVLSNGHCVGGFIKNGDAIVARPDSRTFSLLSGDGKTVITQLTASTLLYGTMTNTDVSLFRLTTTFADIERDFGVKPRTIAEHGPAVGAAITIPSGFWKRVYACTVDALVYELDEATFVFHESIRYSATGCETIGGTSGSPIVDSLTGEVVGINNTGNDDGERCTLDNPCEVDENGEVTVRKGTNYGQQTSWFYTCLDASNGIDLDRPGCRLNKPLAPAARRPDGATK